LILTPALTELPVKLGELSTQRGEFLDLRKRVSRYATFMAAFNASGQPAASLPLFATPEGVPVATQLVGRFGREDVILRVPAQLERADPWKHRKPAFRSEEHTSELQSRENLVCRLLLEKKKTNNPVGREVCCTTLFLDALCRWTHRR